MVFVINNIMWQIRFCQPNSPNLVRSDGTYTLAVTDWNDKTVYITSIAHGAKLDKILCHELCHVFSFSWNLSIPIETEELIADFLATYGRDIFAVADDILRRFTRVA